MMMDDFIIPNKKDSRDRPPEKSSANKDLERSNGLHHQLRDLMDLTRDW
jgi:hypothetical protein